MTDIDRLTEQAQALLRDVDYRIGVLVELLQRMGIRPGEAGAVLSTDLNLATHILDGYTFTDNSPSGGSIAWSSAHIVYKGTDYTITDGDTDLKYVWWDYDAEPNTEFQVSDTKPTLETDDVLVAINEDGMAPPTW